MTDTTHGNGLQIIHISWAGPEYWISVGDKTGDPLDNQPGERDKFWLHYDAWAKQGKKTKTLGGKVWCDYKTELQAWRRSIADTKPPNVRANAAPRP